MFAKRPLRLEEFYFAMEAGLGSEPRQSSTWRPQPWDQEEISKDAMAPYVLNSSKGLAELTTSKQPTVQFLHEFVRDFLVKDGGLREIWPCPRDEMISSSHDQLKLCFRRYLNLDQ